MLEGHQFLFRVIFVTAALVAVYNAVMIHKEVFAPEGKLSSELVLHIK